jgi:hypothetical protein
VAIGHLFLLPFRTEPCLDTIVVDANWDKQWRMSLEEKYPSMLVDKLQRLAIASCL